MHAICVTCGTQFAATPTPPAHCPICEDERQYVGWNGQQWTTLEDLQREHRNAVATVEPGLSSIITEPKFAIGQRAFLIRTAAGNVLWDCLTLIDDATVAAVRALGGIAAIAISHPHYYSCMVEWSRAFDAPIHLHAADRQWVMRPDPAVVFWEGARRALLPGVTLVHCGGHFAGGTALHWEGGAAGRGVLLSGDIIQVVADRRYVTFMYSYPNVIPLPASAVRGIVAAVEPFAYDRLYNAFTGGLVDPDAKDAVTRSAARYITAISD